MFVINSFFPYQKIQKRKTDNDTNIIITNLWKYYDNLTTIDGEYFFLNNIQIDPNNPNSNIQVALNLENIKELENYFEIFMPKKIKKFDVTENLYPTLSYETFLEFIESYNYKINILLSPLGPIFGNNEYTKENLLKNYNIFIEKVKDKKNVILLGNKEFLDKTNNNVILTDIYLDNFEKDKEIFNILDNTYGLSGYKNNLLLENIIKDNKDNNKISEDIKKLLFTNKLEDNNIDLPIFKPKEEKEKDFFDYIRKKNIDISEDKDNIIFFKYLVTHNFIGYLKNFNIEIEQDDFYDFLLEKDYKQLLKYLKDNGADADVLMPELKKVYTSKEWYKKVVKKAKDQKGNLDFEKYFIQLIYEFVLLQYVGYVNYLLIVRDYTAWCQRNNILVGPGRGSAAGSLLVFFLHITNIDPIKYDLMFGRFINPQRISPPDIDIDFEDQYRHLALAYVQSEYGYDNVIKIGTYNNLQLKSSFIQSSIYHQFKDAQKRLKIQEILEDFEDDIMNNNIDESLINNMVGAANIIATDEEKEQLLNIVKQIPNLFGKPVGLGIHACGVIISPRTFKMTYNTEEEHSIDSVQKFHNIFNNNDIFGNFKNKVLDDTKFKLKTGISSGPEFEGKIGLLKFDFLGLSTLSLIKNTFVLAQQRYKELKNISAFDFMNDILYNKIEDSNVYKVFQEGFTTGVFQFESKGMKKYLKELVPDNINDIVAMVALYRPGPMGYIPAFIHRKHLSKILKVLEENNSHEEFDIKDKLNKNLYDVYKDDILKVKFKVGIKKYLNTQLKDENNNEKDKNRLLFLLEEWIKEDSNAGFYNYIENLYKDKKIDKDFIKYLDDIKLNIIIQKFNNIIYNTNEASLLKEEQAEELKKVLENKYTIAFLGNDIKNKIKEEKGNEVLEEQENKLEILKRITKNTFGIFIYQEQLMKMSQLIAGFSSSEADWLRKVIGKKKKDQMPKLKKRFMQGCIEKGILEEIADYLFEQVMVPAGSYSFNLSHAASYANISFITAYLKYYYPSEFFCSLLDINLQKTESKDLDKTKIFLAISDILYANYFSDFKNKKIFDLKIPVLQKIRDRSFFEHKNENGIEKNDIYINPKFLKGISEKMLEKIGKLKKPYDNFNEMFKDKIANKTEITGLISSIFITLKDVEAFFKGQEKDKINEIIDIIYNKLNKEYKHNVKRHLIEYLVLYFIMFYNDQFSKFYLAITEYQKAYDKQSEKKLSQVNSGLSLFDTETFFDADTVKKEIENELLSKEKTNYFIFGENINKILRGIKNIKEKEDLFNILRKILQFNISEIIQKNKIDILTLSKIINLLFLFDDSVSEENQLEVLQNIYILMDVKKINRGQDYFVYFLNSDFSNIIKKFYRNVKKNHELFSFFHGKKGSLSKYNKEKDIFIIY